MTTEKNDKIENKECKDVSKKWSIQISKELHERLKKHCDERGYKLSGFVEVAIKKTISGSLEIESTIENKKQLLNG